MNKYNEISDSVDRCNRDYFQGLTVTMGSVNQIFGFSLLAMIISYVVLFFTSKSHEYMQSLIQGSAFLISIEIIFVISVVMILAFIIPASKYYLFKYQRIVSVFIPLSLIMVLYASSAMIALIAFDFKAYKGAFSNMSFEEIILYYVIINICVLFISNIYGVFKLKKKMKTGYSVEDNMTNYKYKQKPRTRNYFMFIGISSIIGGLTLSFQFMILVALISFLLIYSGKYLPELVYLAYLRNTDDYYQEVLMDKPDTIKIILNLLTKFSTYTWIALVVWLLLLGRMMLSPIESEIYFYQMNRVESILYFGSFGWLWLVAPGWWILKKLCGLIFMKKEN